MNSTKKGSYNSASTEEYTIRPNPADNTSPFAERAIKDFGQKFNGLIFQPVAEILVDFFRTKLAEAEQRGRDSAVDYVHNHKHSEEAVKGLWYVSDDTFEAARRLTTPS